MSGVEYADEILEPVELREHGHETVILSVGNLNLAENTVHQSPGPLLAGHQFVHFRRYSGRNKTSRNEGVSYRHCVQLEGSD